MSFTCSLMNFHLSDVRMFPVKHTHTPARYLPLDSNRYRRVLPVLQFLVHGNIQNVLRWDFSHSHFLLFPSRVLSHGHTFSSVLSPH